MLSVMQCSELLLEHEDHNHDRLLEHENTVRSPVRLCSWLTPTHLPHCPVFLRELLTREERLDQTLHLSQLYHFSACFIEIGDTLPTVKSCRAPKKIEESDESEAPLKNEL